MPADMLSARAVTLTSALIALVIASVESLAVLASTMHWKGAFWTLMINAPFEVLGYLIIGASSHLPSLPASLPACLPACLPASLPPCVRQRGSLRRIAAHAAAIMLACRWWQKKAGSPTTLTPTLMTYRTTRTLAAPGQSLSSSFPTPLTPTIRSSYRQTRSRLARNSEPTSKRLLTRFTLRARTVPLK